MATIDLGKIKLVWRGTYNNGTAYTVDDVVQYTDSGLVSSYICTTNSTGNAPSSSGTAHGSWAYLAKGGSTYTSTLTTQGDVLYRDGSGEARLAKGTAGQALKMNSGATAPEWGTISSDFVKISSGNLTGATAYLFDNLDTSTYKSFKMVMSKLVGETSSTDAIYFRYRYNNSGSQATYDSSQYIYRLAGKYSYGGQGDAGETSSSSLQSTIRCNWAMAKNSSSNKYTQALILEIPSMEVTDGYKHINIRSFGCYYNDTEYFQYNNGGGTCREVSQAFNGFSLHAGNNWRGTYSLYGLK